MERWQTFLSCYQPRIIPEFLPSLLVLLLPGLLFQVAVSASCCSVPGSAVSSRSRSGQ